MIKWKSSTLDCGWDAWVCENTIRMAYQPWSRDFYVNWWKDDGKSYTIAAMDYAHPKVVDTWVRIRKLTPIECERLQTLPDNYTEWVSDSQRYKMLWNWWTVEVIAHIFRNMNTWWLKEQPLF